MALDATSATAGSKISIGTTAAAADLTGFEADTYTEIKRVEDLGEWGVQATELTRPDITERYVRRRKGTRDSGSIELIVSRDPLDPGQIALQAAMSGDNADLAHNFKVELNDRPTADGTNTIFYFRGFVYSARNNFGGADNIVKTTFTIGIDGAILEVPAAEAVAP